MLKIVTADSWPFNEPAMQLVKFSSRGLRGSDLDSLVKRAGHAFANQLMDYRPQPGEIPVHMLAMGSTEAYGPNRNGDGFKEATCRRFHDTFVKSAKVYRHHKNTDPKISYGTVKCSTYNESMRRVELLLLLNATKEAAEKNDGFVADQEIEKLARGEDIPGSMACFTDPNYPILTRDRGYVPISRIKVGDHVWTHRGRWRPVKQLNRRRYTGEVLKFHLNGLSVPLEVTADHPMMARVFAGSRQSAAIKAKAGRYFANPAAFEQEPPAWHHASHVGVGDRFFHQPVTRYDGYGRVSSVDLAMLMGYYLAEGSFGYNGERACTVEFTCHADDAAVRRIPQILARLFPDVTVDIEPKENSACALALRVFNTNFAEFLRSQIGAGCRTKLIPPEIFNASDEVKLAFVGAWLDGDGWLDKKGAHWSTTSIGLALQGRDLLASIGVPASIYRIDHANCPTSGYAKSGVEFTLNVGHLDAWRLTEYSWKAANYPPPTAEQRGRKRPAALRLCPDGRYAVRVKQVESRYVSDCETFNFEVEEDESYSAAGLISHNCKVDYDECSSCFNKAATRAHYCDEDSCVGPKGEKRGGCRHNLTKVCEDGHLLHVDNPHPHFFDISSVVRPADRIAFGAKADYLLKAASSEVIGGAGLADEIGLVLPTWLQLGKESQMTEIVRRLADEEARLSQGKTAADDTIATAIAERKLRVPEVSWMGSPGSTKFAHALRALSDNHVLMSLEMFARTQFDDRFKAAEVSRESAELLPGIFTRALQSFAKQGSLFASEEFRPASGLPSAEQRGVAHRLAEDYRVSKEAVQKGIFRSVFRNTSSPGWRAAPDVEKLASASESARRLATKYAAYQVAYLAALSPDSREIGLTLTSCVLQNAIM